MANFNIVTVANQCQVFWGQVKEQDGLVPNPDGTLSVYLKNSQDVVSPVEITKMCCNALGNISDENIYFDLDTQKCRYSAQSDLDCGFDKPFKIVLNPVDNHGATFSVEDDEIAALTVDFDYLFKFDCESLSQKITQSINPNVTQAIKDKENEILIRTSECEEIASRLAFQEALFNNTRYSVYCDLLAMNDNLVVDNQTITPSTVVYSQNTYVPKNGTISVTTPVTAPKLAYLGNVDLSKIFNKNLFPNNSFLITRAPISNLFVPKIQTRPDLINNLIYKLTSDSKLPTLTLAKLPDGDIPRLPSANTPLKQVLINSTLSTKQKVPFTKTGFGTGFTIGAPPFSFPNTLYTSSNRSFCITEPEGLNAWRLILGDAKFTNFINGDDTSYSASSVIELYDSTTDKLLIYPCDTPFSAKTAIQKTINEIKIEQQNCQIKLDELNKELQGIIDINTVDIDICGTPISVLENLNVSVTIDAMTNTGLTTVYEYQLFDAIDTGNLYSYLVSKKDNSGFFVCGKPNQSETWATGCTSLMFPEFLTVPIVDPHVKTNVTSCSTVKNYFNKALFEQSGLSGQTNGLSVFNKSLTSNILSSNWLHSTKVINDKNVIDKIKNNSVKISIKVNTSCGDLCVLIDHIKLEKNITKVTGNNILLTKSPGFKLSRIVDNKKSWLDTSLLKNRNFSITDINGNNPIRQTDYKVDDERLIINSKEIDLDIDISSGIETDFWNYVTNNDCLFAGRTEIYDCNNPYNYLKQFQDSFCFNFENGDIYTFMDDEPLINVDTEIPKDFQDTGDYDDFYFQDDILYTFNGIGYITSKCGDDKLNFRKLITTDFKNISTVQNFNDFITSEFIDAKNRQTIIGYGTLRALYERYLDSGAYCNTISNKFDYISMNTFANLLNNYWINVIEQVIPATTIWGSAKVYRNTIFDEQKYKYRSYTSFFVKEDFSGVTAPSPIDDTYGMCEPVEVITSIITNKDSTDTTPITTKYNFIKLVQMNTSSEFIGSIKI